jgi:hypothetical protein
MDICTIQSKGICMAKCQKKKEKPERKDAEK